MDSREPIEDHELAACPFCGAPGDLAVPAVSMIADCDDVCVECSNCEARSTPVLIYHVRADEAGRWPEQEAEAIAAWNRRPSPVAESTPTDAAAVEAEREELLSLRAFRDRILAAVAFAPPLDDQAAGRIADDLRSGLSLRQCARKHGVTIGIVRGIRSRTPKES